MSVEEMRAMRMNARLSSRSVRAWQDYEAFSFAFC